MFAIDNSTIVTGPIHSGQTSNPLLFSNIYQDKGISDNFHILHLLVLKNMDKYTPYEGQSDWPEVGGVGGWGVFDRNLERGDSIFHCYLVN